ncbi:MAG TPA: RHS repeat-associated core domain-containing protein, partial [Terriglobales bacterium]|nr:RHS repeat-associated core domain-containing protein [Terriglobales bacterium]
TDDNQIVVWDGQFEPFGQEHGIAGSITAQLRFPGQYYDPETQLSQNWHREYDPTLGRYVQSDPIGLWGGLSTFGYGDLMPNRKIDATGLATYICKRELGVRPGTTPLPIWNHRYVCVDTPVGMVCGSTDPSGAVPADNIWPRVGTPGQPTSSDWDYYDERSCKKEKDDDSCVEGCIAGKILSKERPWYQIGPNGTDCQEWVDQVLDECSARCSK